MYSEFGRGYPHKQINKAISLSWDVLKSPHGKNYLKAEVNSISSIISQIDGFVGVFCTGYPFYGKDREVPEIKEFLKTTSNLVKADEERNRNGWPCPDCQVVKKLPDLKKYCKPCAKVDLKPRDLFKALPDVDMLVAVDSITPTAEEQVQKTMGRLGYLQSDSNIAGSIDDTVATLSALRSGNETSKKLPIDVHLVNKSDFFQSLLSMQRGDLGVETPTRSLHSQWEDDKHPLGFDFIFSLTPILIIDADIRSIIHATRKALKLSCGADKLVSAAESASPRAKRLLSDVNIRKELHQRIAEW